MMPQIPSIIMQRIYDAILRLRALREGEQAVLDLVACGPSAVEPLREFLFLRDSSGMFQPRCQAVEALMALGAKDVLLAFLTQQRDVADPVEQAGEDAVTNAVARALSRWQEDHIFSLLLEIGRHKLLAGVVEALGNYRREEAVPIFAAALGDDFCRPAAEKAFRKLGASSCPCLLQLARDRTPSLDAESESSRRRRRSALRLFVELQQGEDLLVIMRSYLADADSQVVLLACSIYLLKGSPAEQEKVAARLINLFSNSDWILHEEVEELLIQQYANCRAVIEKRLTQSHEPATASLRRVVMKGCATLGLPLPQYLLHEIEMNRKADSTL